MDDLPLRYRCDRRWDELSGRGPRRYCDRCDEIVYDLESMTTAERQALLTRPTPACVRFLSAAVLAMMVTGPAYAQEAPQQPPQETPSEGDDAPVVPGEGPLPDLAPKQEIMGALDKTFIDRIITARFDELRAAYHERLEKKPGLEGKLVVKFTIEDGVVSRAEVRSSTLGDAPLEKIVIEYVRSLTFEHTGTVAISYPFVFAP